MKSCHYEMTEDVKKRIESAYGAELRSLPSVCLGYNLYGLHRQARQRKKQGRASREEMRYFIELMGKPKPHPTMNRKYWMPRMLHRFHTTQGRVPLQPEEEPDWANEASHYILVNYA